MGGGMSLILSGTNGLSDVDGSAATPAIRGTDANTGMFFPAADTIAFAEGGTESMRLDSNGNVGIGTSTPGAKLDVNGSILCRAGGGEGGEISLNNPDNASVGVIFDVGVADSARLFGVRNNFSLALGQLAGTGGFIDCYTAGSLRTRIDSGGNLLVGITAQLADEKFRVASTTTSGVFQNTTAASTRPVIYTQHTGSSGGTSKNHLEFLNSGGGTVGTIACTGTATAYNTSSDYRLKEDVQPMTGALAKVAALKPCTYKWKADGTDGEGFIAHELQAVVPDAVTGAKDAVDADGKPVYQGIDTSFLVATLTAALQEQQAMIEQLKADVAALKGTV
jgi:hypothetical protein